MIQGQIPERSWENPAVLEFCSCTSHRDGSRILGPCTHLELSKATWKRLQVPTRHRSHVGFRIDQPWRERLRSKRSRAGTKGTSPAAVRAWGARRRRRRWRLRFCGDAARKGRQGCKQWRVDARIASAARLERHERGDGGGCAIER